MVEVYAQTKPPVGRRAILAAAALLLIACALAWTMSRSRSGHPRRVRIEPAGWFISFEAPFRRYQENRSETGYAFTFFERLPDNARIYIHFQRVRSDRGESDAEVADRVALSFAERNIPLLGYSSVFWFDRRLGPFEAVQVWNPSLDVLVRLARVEPDDDIYAVAITGERRLDPELYALFESVCNSVEPR